MIFNCNDLHGVANGEKEALDRYSNLLAKYRDEFLIYGAYIDLKLVWMNQLTRRFTMSGRVYPRDMQLT